MNVGLHRFRHAKTGIIALIVAAVMAFTELFPQFGLSIFPDRNESWDSQRQRSTSTARRFIGFATWATLFALTLYKNDGRRAAEMTLAVGLIYLVFYLTRSQKYGVGVFALYIIAWLLFAWSLCDGDRECVKQLMCWKVMVLIGVLLIQQGRFSHLVGVDYVGRVVFAVAIIGFMYYGFSSNINTKNALQKPQATTRVLCTARP